MRSDVWYLEAEGGAVVARTRVAMQRLLELGYVECDRSRYNEIMGIEETQGELEQGDETPDPEFDAFVDARAREDFQQLFSVEPQVQNGAVSYRGVVLHYNFRRWWCEVICPWCGRLVWYRQPIVSLHGWQQMIAELAEGDTTNLRDHACTGEEAEDDGQRAPWSMRIKALRLAAKMVRSALSGKIYVEWQPEDEDGDEEVQ